MKLQFSKPTFFLSLAIIIFTAVFFSLAVYKYQNFRFDQEDLAIFNNVFYNTTHGRPFWFTIHGGYSYLGDHLELTLLLLIPFYYFLQSPLMLLFLQIFLYALAAWPLYLIFNSLTKPHGQNFCHDDCSSQAEAAGRWEPDAKRRPRLLPSPSEADEFRRKKILSLGLCFIFLLSPFIQNLALEEFHAAPLVLFFFLWTVYFYFQKKYRLFLLFFILTLLSREDAAITLGALTVIAAWDNRHALWQNKKWWLYPLAGAVIWFFLALKIIAFFGPDNNYKYLLLYQGLINNLSHPLYILFHLLNGKNLWIIVGYLLPFLFFPLLRPKYLLLMLPTILQVFLMDAGGTNLLYTTRYQIFILVGLFLALAAALQKLSVRQKTLALVLLAVAQIYTSFYFGPLQFATDTEVAKILPNLENQKINRRVIKLIPPQAGLSAPYRLLPHLASRKDIYVNKLAFLGKGHLSAADFTLPANIDYFLLDTTDMVEYYLHFKNRLLQNPLYWGGAGRLRALFEEHNFNPVFIADNLVLFHRGAPSSTPLYSFDKKSPTDLKGGRKDLGELEFLGWRQGEAGLPAELPGATEPNGGAANREAGLTELWWQTKQPIQDDYFLEVSFIDSAGKTWNKIYPPAFGLLPTHDWPASSAGRPAQKIIMTAQSFIPPAPNGRIKLTLVKLQGDIELDPLNSVRLIADKKETIGELFENTFSP